MDLTPSALPNPVIFAIIQAPWEGLFKNINMLIFNKILDYLRSAKNELTKVTWPSKQNTTRYSVLVIVISLSVAAFFGLLDMGLSKLVAASLANKTAAPTEPVEPVGPAPDIQTDVPSIDFDSVAPISTPDNGTPDTQTDNQE